MADQPKSGFHKKHSSRRLLNKVALITGGDSGIGRAVAIAFAREGADLAISFLNEKEDAEETKLMVESLGSTCILLPGDIGDKKTVENIVADSVEKYGKLDILVNNAGEQNPIKDITHILPEQIEGTFRTNIFAMFYLAQSCLPFLKDGGVIINTASVTAYKGNPVLMDYSATKGAIVSFTRSLALSLAKDDIRVNAVAPGPVWTPLITSTFDTEAQKKFGKDTAMGRPGQPEEVAPAYVFLASSDSSYITGQVIHVNGGQIVNS